MKLILVNLLFAMKKYARSRILLSI